jgi:hypothetical protein
MPSVSVPAFVTADAAAGAGGTLAAGAAASSAAAGAGSFASYLSAASVAGSLFSGITGAMGSAQQANAAANSAAYQAAVAENNETIAKQNANWDIQAGEAAASQEQQKTRAVVGSELAAQAASGVDVNTGSALDVRSSSAQLGELNQLTIRSNAARQSWADLNNANSFSSQAALSRMEASNAPIAGEIGEAGSVLSGATSAASKYASWLNSGGTNLNFF